MNDALGFRFWAAGGRLTDGPIKIFTQLSRSGGVWSWSGLPLAWPGLPHHMAGLARQVSRPCSSLLTCCASAVSSTSYHTCTRSRTVPIYKPGSQLIACIAARGDCSPAAAWPQPTRQASPEPAGREGGCSLEWALVSSGAPYPAWAGHRMDQDGHSSGQELARVRGRYDACLLPVGGVFLGSDGIILRLHPRIIEGEFRASDYCSRDPIQPPSK